MKLRIEDVDDSLLRENFQRIKEQIESYPILRGNWLFVELTIPKAVTDYKFKHNLGFIPKDVIQTSVVGAPVVWSYSKFSSIYGVLTTTGATKVRFFIGAYSEKGNE